MNNQFISWLRSLRVRQKIAWGYALSLGIAVVGTGIGIFIADYKQKIAVAKVEDVLEELEILSRLQVDVLQTYNHQLKIKQVLDRKELAQQEYIDFKEHYQNLQQSWTNFKDSHGGTAGQEKFEHPGEVEAINAFLIKYEGVPETYFQAIDRLLSRLNPDNIKSANITSIQTDITKLEQSILMAKVHKFSADLLVLVKNIYQEYEEAEEAIDASNLLRLWVIGGSMAASIAIAAVLSWLTSRAIARPIHSLTQVTQQSLQELNFNLRAEISGKDEIGTLTLSFNQLIATVKQLLKEQQEYSQTLEKKVWHRTQELENKNNELEDILKTLHSTQLQLVQNEKMSSLGNLVAGVAHEINNPIGFLNGSISNTKDYIQDILEHLSLYQQYYPDAVKPVAENARDIDLEFTIEDLPKILNSMQAATDRIQSMSKSLRTFSRADTDRKVKANLHEGLESTLLILKYRLKASEKRPEINIIRDYGNLPEIECFPGQLNQVFMNILANAIDVFDEMTQTHSFAELKANPQQITIRTEIADDSLRDSFASRVQIRILDNGTGMSEDVKAQIFDNLFTTKAVGKGTGLGLAIARQIVVEKHGGSIEVDSTLGKGTEFTIQLPVKG
ncbi:MAG: HAMP domain-containing protein [Oscillatoriales cyanobacterium RU_3_3]|nr:HAMP domain-containing protein [Oscillatoriales cyanobacterium RU_3_3]NJR22887.1 HAMP domain-containing protein [Richelia sp. CSU_2_1]